MNERPKVSIVMPVYNAGEWLELALQSVFAQTISDWELIAVDDASTDDSWAYLNRLDDPRVRLLRNERNMKHGATLNRALEASRGQYVARMDADDAMMPNRLEKQLEALEADSSIDMLSCGIFQTDLELNPINVRRPISDDAAIKRLPAIRYPLTYGAILGKREWWLKWKVDRRAIYSTSFDLFLRSHRESRFSNVPDPLYVYRYIGHTRNLRKQTLVVWDRMKTLVRAGFNRGPRLAAHSVVGMALLAPRPLIYAVKNAIGSYTAIVPSEGEGAPAPEDIETYERGMAEVRATTLPLKPDAH